MPGAAHALRRRRAGGFTIVEAAVAGAIVTVFLTGLFALNSNMMHLLRAMTETTNASQDLQQRVEQVRLANWSQITDPSQYAPPPGPSNTRYNFASLTDAAINLPGLVEVLVVRPYSLPTSAPAPSPTPPPPYAAVRKTSDNTITVYTLGPLNPGDPVPPLQPDGTLPPGTPQGYSYASALGAQDMVRVDLITTWPSFSRSRSRTMTTIISRWGISK